MQPNLNVERQYNKMSSIQDMIGHLYSINLNMNYIDNLAMFENVEQPQHELHWQSRHVCKRCSSHSYRTYFKLFCKEAVWLLLQVTIHPEIEMQGNVVMRNWQKRVVAKFCVVLPPFFNNYTKWHSSFSSDLNSLVFQLLCTMTSVTSCEL